MAATVLDMSMSLDGFIAGPNLSRENGLGDGGSRLHEWFLGPTGSFDDRVLAPLSGPDERAFDEIMATGAVLVGRGTIEPAGAWNGDHHDGVPIVVMSRHPVPPEFAGYERVRYVSDLADAVRLAREGAGERDVLVHGAEMAQLLLRAGELNVIQLHLVPVLLGQGRRLFEGMPAEQTELAQVRAEQGREALHLRYRVLSK
ncbi:dihydrofolate reductase family protein [Ruania alba]|uniref:Dihydrofolate reductase n=1 Tax=Ruania alba TaxID=648782 RepID=A0A1H5N3U6_9MICO|nr:dihydrofolate reductase family protein [Ruania alba]SEE95561.1 Dihydrofolate reductase [Ruania alba]